MPHQICTQLADTSQVGEARRSVAKVAQTLDMSATRLGEAAIVATELATNLARYGQDGRLLVQALTTPNGPCVEILAIDSGPGIADLQRSMRDGYSTGGTPGTGFGAVRRLSTEFDVYSTVGKGTVVMSRLRTDAPTTTFNSPFTFGAVSFSAPHESVCGDAWQISERPGEIAAMLADGLGHGPLAAEAAQLAVDAFDRAPFDDGPAFFDHAHRALVASRGAALAHARVTRDARLQYSGLGNIAGYLLADERGRGLPTQNGTVGMQPRKVVAAAYDWPARGLLIMHSDGITNRWSIDAYPGLRMRHPAVIAGVLARDYVRGKDDATVLVVGSAYAS